MKSRSLYAFLLRLHPPRFRDKYEDQMLWIFDESVQSRGVVSLLFDALVSLVRQWVFRSGGRRSKLPSSAIDGVSVLAESLHQNSQKLFLRAWRVNVLWLLWAVVVLLLCPMPIFGKLQFVFYSLLTLSLISGRKPVRGWPPRLHYISLFYYKVSREFYRAEIESRRDGLRTWVGKTNEVRGAGSIVVIFLILMLLWMARPVLRGYMGLPNAGLDWDHSRYFVYGIVVLGVSFRLLTRVNESAAEAIQQELNAMDGGAK